MDEKVTDVLKEIGLGKVEIDVYIDLLRSKVSTPAEVAKRTHQHRSNVYDALKRLQQKGFITEVIEQNRRFFESKLPDVIFSYLKQKEIELKEILPILEELSKRKPEHETTSTSYGLPRIRAILHNLIENEKEVIFWGISDEIEIFLTHGLMEDLLKQRAKRKKPTKILYNGKSERLNKLSNMKHQKIKYFPKQNHSSMAIISNETVFTVVFNDHVTIIEVNSKAVSQWYRSQFENLWKTAYAPFSLEENVVKKATTFKRKFKRNLKKLFSDNQKK